jgi:hypothetical protein
MIEECGLPREEAVFNAVYKLLNFQPKARAVRLEQSCPICKGKTTAYLSYILPSFDKSQNGATQYCGYYCSRCDFTGAGSRRVQA